MTEHLGLAKKQRPCMLQYDCSVINKENSFIAASIALSSEHMQLFRTVALVLIFYHKGLPGNVLSYLHCSDAFNVKCICE